MEEKQRKASENVDNGVFQMDDLDSAIQAIIIEAILSFHRSNHRIDFKI